MKNFLVLVFFAVIALVFMGCFTVNIGENAIVYSKLHKTQYYNKSGLYFAIPVIDKVKVIYMNNREIFLNLAIEVESQNTYRVFNNESGVAALDVGIMINWHVTNGKKYVNALDKYGQTDFNQIFVTNIAKYLLQNINGVDIKTLNQKTEILSNDINIDSLGLSLDQIALSSVMYLDNPQNNIIESRAIANTAESTNLDMQNRLIESAYYQAQAIKTQTEIYQAGMYDKIKKQHPQFYNYFRLIDVYKNSAKSKLDVPAFNKLYH